MTERCLVCGHERSWHAADGGPCEQGPPCECPKYVAGYSVSLFDLPLPVSRWKRFKAWLRRRPIEPMTAREAQRLFNAQLYKRMMWANRDVAVANIAASLERGRAEEADRDV